MIMGGSLELVVFHKALEFQKRPVGLQQPYRADGRCVGAPAGWSSPPSVW